jgi:hypothetical protein
MSRRFLRIALALAASMLAGLLVGCGPNWQILRQANPDPFLKQTRFAVLPVNFTGLRVGEKSEADYLAEKEAEAKNNWAGDKLGLNEDFTTNLISRSLEHGITVVPATGPADAPFVIRPSVAWLEPGFYIGIAAGSSKVKMTIQITAPDGAVLDELIIEHGTGGSVQNAAVGTRLREDGENIGIILGDYLKTRVSPEAG